MFVNSNAGINKLGLMSTALPEVCTDSRGAGREGGWPEAMALRCFLGCHQPARKIQISAWPAASRGALAPARSRWGSWAGQQGEDGLPKPHPLSDDMSTGSPELGRARSAATGTLLGTTRWVPGTGEGCLLLPPNALMLLRVPRCQCRCGVPHFQAFH